MPRRCMLAGLLALLVSPGAANAQKKIDLSRLVVVGDSISAGFQNFSLMDAYQKNSYTSIIATQARVPLVLPLIAAPGVPNTLQLVSAGPPPVIVNAPGASSGRTNPFDQPTNLAVPAARVQDALTTRPDFPLDTLTDLVLGFPGLFMQPSISRSQVEWAEALQPSAVLVWIGNNDVLLAAMAGNASEVTPAAAFEAAYAELLGRLAATGATIIVGNVPDITLTPGFTPAEKIAEQAGAPLTALGPVLGIGPGSYVTTAGLPLIPAILANPSLGPLPATVVLDASEVSVIRTAVRDYNTIIQTYARLIGAPVVDINAVLQEIHARGYVVGGQRLNTSFLGGLFSLDGIHPTNTAAAIIANEFIKVLNRTYSAGIPPVSVMSVQKQDPLVFP